VWVLEGAKVAVFEQVVDERLHPLVHCLALDALHHLVERRFADVLLHVVVARGLTDEFLRVLRGLE